MSDDGYREVIADWLAARGFDREFNVADLFINDLRKDRGRRRRRPLLEP